MIIIVLLTDWSVILIWSCLLDRYMEPILSASTNAFKFSLIVLIFASVGSIMQIVGGNWDVTSHLLLTPESFFTPSHALLYTGIGILSLSSIIGGILMLKYRELKKSSLALSFKLLIIGSIPHKSRGNSKTFFFLF